MCLLCLVVATAILLSFLMQRNFKTTLCVLLLVTTFACTATNYARRDGPVSRILTDDLGRTVSLPVKVDRVVSLAPNWSVEPVTAISHRKRNPSRKSVIRLIRVSSEWSR